MTIFYVDDGVFNKFRKDPEQNLDIGISFNTSELINITPTIDFTYQLNGSSPYFLKFHGHLKITIVFRKSTHVKFFYIEDSVFHIFGNDP